MSRYDPSVGPLRGLVDEPLDFGDFDPANRAEWPLADGLVYLNHGTVGVTPSRIFRLRHSVLAAIEADPAAAIVRGLADIYGTGLGEESRLRQALEPVAAFVGADLDGLAFVRNITEAANAVFSSIRFDPGDEILITSLGYGGVSNVARYHARRAGATVRVVEMPPLGCPPSDYAQTVSDSIGPRTTMVLVDHLAANSALVLPVAEIVAECRRRGVLSFVDGAHAPGAVEVDIALISPDFYAANLHKWAFTPRPVGILWAAVPHRATLHPASVSWGLDRGIAAEFDFPGTIDPSPFLVTPAALELFSSARPPLAESNARRAFEAAEHLAGEWGTEFNTPREMVGPMAAIRLPLHAGDGRTHEELQRLLRASNIEIAVNDDVVPDAYTVRLAIQSYVTDADIERLAYTVNSLG